LPYAICRKTVSAIEKTAFATCGFSCGNASARLKSWKVSESVGQADLLV
jgi:hypothetical protein